MTTSPTPAERIAALKAKAAEKVKADQVRGEVTIVDNEIVISVNGARGSFDQRLAHVKRLNVRRYDGDRKAWIAPFSQAAQVQSLVEKAILVVEQGIRIELAGIIAEQATLAADSAAGSADDFELNFYLPDGLALFPYQKAGVKYAVKQRRLIIGDEMGLGKTLQAAAAIVHEGIERAVVACPAVVWQKWQDEIARFFPKVNVQGVGSRTATPIALDKGIVVVGQDVLKDWAEVLIDWAPSVLVLDESHSYKDPSALRSKAAMMVAGAVPTSGLVMLLTGTAIQNRPAELIQQLRIIGRLQEISGSAKNFLYRYGDGTPMGQGTHDQHVALLEALRATCYLRRNQADVAPELPDIFRTELRVEDNPVALKVYKDAEEDIAKWIAENLDEDEVEARIKAHMRNEAITRMTYLRKLAALVKLPAIANWAADFATEKPLVIFAHHKEVIDGLVSVLGCPKIDGGVPAAKRAVICKDFQAGKHQVIVVSTRAGGVGIDLFRADTVLFVEADWSPGAWQQAEFRVKRHGQQANKVMSIFARTHAETIDSYMAEVVARKWTAIEAINAGRDDQRIADRPDRYVDHVYGEKELGGTSVLYLSRVPFEKLGFPTYGEKPFPAFSKAALGAVPPAVITVGAMLGAAYALFRKRAQAVADSSAASKHARTHGHVEFETLRSKLLTPFNWVLLLIMAFGAVSLVARFILGLGGSTNLSDTYPWGLWIVFDLVWIAVAAGAFAMAGVIYILQRKDLYGLGRTAVLMGLLSYSFVTVTLIADLGLPWHVYALVLNAPEHSAMFEVSWCIGFYVTILLLEFLPVAFEHWGFNQAATVWRRWNGAYVAAAVTLFVFLMSRNLLYALATAVTFGALAWTFRARDQKAEPVMLAIAAVTLSTMHQSSLGSLYLLMPNMLDPRWWSPVMPVSFLLSSIVAGTALVILVEMWIAKGWRRSLEITRLASVGQITCWALVVYLVFRLGDMAFRNQLSGALAGTLGIAFAAEILLGGVLPLVLLARRSLRQRADVLCVASLLAVIGVMYNRVNVVIFAMTFRGRMPWVAPESYVPSIVEWGISIGLIATTIFLFGLGARLMPVLSKDKMAHQETA